MGSRLLDYSAAVPSNMRVKGRRNELSGRATELYIRFVQNTAHRLPIEFFFDKIYIL